MIKKKKHDFLPFTEAERKIIEKFAEHRNHAAKKFPLGFALVATFGLVTTMQGFQRLIDKIPLLHNNPWISFVTGLAILVASGTVYKKLG